MEGVCPAINDNQFLSSVLSHIDCQAQTLGSSGYHAMSNGESALLMLGGVLTIFIALFGYRLILGETPDARTGILTVIKLSVVLVLATSWPAFRTIAYDVALKAPAELADKIGGASGLPGTGGELVVRLQAIDDQMAELTMIGTGKPPGADFAAGLTPRPQTPEQQDAERRRLEQAASRARWDPARDLSTIGSARTIYLAATIGAFASTRLLAGLLLALGPLFAIFLLFEGTRGLFEGWARGLAGAALAALGSAIVLGVEITLLEPWLSAVMELRHQEVATPAVPIELLALTLIFAITLIAMLAGIARVAQGFHMSWIRTREQVVSKPGESALALSGERTASGVSHDQRSRAIAIADAVTATQWRESLAGPPAAVSFSGRPEIAPTATREVAVIGAMPLGQSFRRRTRGRVSAGATRRDSNR